MINDLNGSFGSRYFLYVMNERTCFFFEPGCAKQAPVFKFGNFPEQFPVGLLAQLVERCTGIAAVMGSNPVQA